jgi:hypothetical protein
LRSSFQDPFRLRFATRSTSKVMPRGEKTPGGCGIKFACVAETANRPDDALRYLQEAIDLGYKNADGLMADDDLKKLRPNPKFQQLVAGLKTPSQKSSAQ